MPDGRLKNSIRNTVSGIMSCVLKIIFPFIIRTVIIKKIGMEYTGLDGLFSSVLMMPSISELGFGSALVYSMYRPIAETDDEKINSWVKNLNLILLLSAVMFLSCFNNWVNIYIPRFNDIFFACVGITCVSAVAMIFQRSKLLRHTGRNTMILFGLHSIPLYACNFI